VQQIGKARAVVVSAEAALAVGDTVTLQLDTSRRRPIEAHHSATHLLHWALHEVVSQDAAQQGSSVDESRLRFDFNSSAVTPEQLVAMEEKVNAAIVADDSVSWTEVKHAEVKGRADIMQFFGDKYGEVVRVVQIGGQPNQLNGYAQELCGGTHVRRTGEIGLFKIKSEGAIASGVRRIEAVCGESAWGYLAEQAQEWREEMVAAQQKLAAAQEKLRAVGESVESVEVIADPLAAVLVERPDITVIHAALAKGQQALTDIQQAAVEAEKRWKKIQSSQAARLADEALADAVSTGQPMAMSFEADASLLQELLNGLKKRQFAQAGAFLIDDGEKLHLGTYCGAQAKASGKAAGSMLQQLAALGGGKGGGNPEMARGAAPDRTKRGEIEAAMKSLIS
jgi:alanyl-tRNA synthetase